MPDISSIILCFFLIFIVSCIGARLFDNPVSIFSMFFYGSSSPPSHSSVICNVCHSAAQRSKNERCECGGKYEPLENWKWEEDEIEETEETN